MPKNANTLWPVIRECDQKHLLRIAMTMGGIGTGTLSLGGRGNLHSNGVPWEAVT